MFGNGANSALDVVDNSIYFLIKKNNFHQFLIWKHKIIKITKNIKQNMDRLSIRKDKP